MQHSMHAGVLLLIPMAEGKRDGRNRTCHRGQQMPPALNVFCSQCSLHICPLEGLVAGCHVHCHPACNQSCRIKEEILQ